ncbi:MAG: hypothetical protein QME58_02365, partial [Bacteroidota bacterium]|nr:hypothetical protein [Bacteroidota bacterium]
MKYLTLFLIVLVISKSTYSQSGAWNYLNFECGGYVTEIIPVKYPAGQQPGNINQQVLYARTDIGGIYRSEDNGQSWKFGSNYVNPVAPPGNPGISISELSIQGLAVRYDAQTGKEIVNVAWGNYENDAEAADFKSIWRSSRNGEIDAWTKSTITPQSVWFKGNKMGVKIGGPCIIYDPNNINDQYSHLYMGGFEPNNGKAYLYKSENDGVNFSRILSFESFQNSTSSPNGEGITCIAIKPGNTSHIWVGTTHGIVFTTNGGDSWNRVSVPGVEEPFVKRIILRKVSVDITGAMFTWGNNSDITGIGRVVKDGTFWRYDDLSEIFLNGLLGDDRGNSMFAPLSFVDNSEGIIVGGKYQRPLRKTSDFGDNWVGEGTTPNKVRLYYDDPAFNKIPKHSNDYQNHPEYPGVVHDQIYSGMNSLVKNPNTGWGTHWYMSGGAGARITSVDVSNDRLSTAKWKYSFTRQSMPVVYDVVFKNANINGINRQTIFIPMSDWTLAWQYLDNLSFTTSDDFVSNALEYDRQKTYDSDLQDTYISNVVRMLNDPDNPNKSYCLGGSVYGFTAEYRRAGFYVRTENNGAVTIARKETHQILTDNDRAVVDAIIFKKPDNVNRIIALVGGNTTSYLPGGSIGVFYSDDGGQSWSEGMFNIQSTVLGKQTSTAYSRSLIAGLKSGIDGSIGDIFNGHFSLSYAESSLVYLWLQSASGRPYGGGLFISTDNGSNWRAGEDIESGDIYWGAGSLKYIGNDKLVLAFRDARSNPKGVYIGAIDRNNSGSVSWTYFVDANNVCFTSADHFDVQNELWAVYGKRMGDAYDQIYRSTNNGLIWTKIPYSITQNFPKVHSLRIRPNSGELWVATGGQGVWVYKLFDPGWISITTGVKDKWNMASVPIIISDYKKTTVWQDANSDALTWEGGPQYVSKDILENRIGYWIKFPQSQTVNYVGVPRDSFRIGVKAGWNMIGSIYQDVPIARVVQKPTGITTSPYYGYDNGYFVTDAIQSGKAYWIKVNQDGEIILDKNSTSVSPPQCSGEQPSNPPGAPPIPKLVKPDSGATGISI